MRGVSMAASAISGHSRLYAGQTADCHTAAAWEADVIPCPQESGFEVNPSSNGRVGHHLSGSCISM